MKIFKATFSILFTTLMLGVLGLFLMPLLPVPGNIEIKIVKSGSMEPEIMTGALVITRPTETYTVGEVITFTNRSSDIPTTHRITEVIQSGSAVSYQTKGDANEEIDQFVVAKKDVLGKVLFDVPYAGFVLDFSRQPLGFSLLVGLPALLIVFSELSKIFGEIKKMRRRESQSAEEVVNEKVQEREVVAEERAHVPEVAQVVRTRERRMMDIGHPVLLEGYSQTHAEPMNVPKKPNRMATISVAGLLVGVTALALLGSGAESTLSYPTDTETSLENSFEASSVDFNISSAPQIRSLAGGFQAEENNTFVWLLESTNSQDVTYDIQAEYISGNTGFCNSIMAGTKNPFEYSGPLSDLAAEDVHFDGEWSLSTSYSGYGQFNPGDSCVIDLIYSAKQNARNGGGYTDEERTTLTFFAPQPEPALESILKTNVPETEGASSTEPLTVPEPLQESAVVILDTENGGEDGVEEKDEETIESESQEEVEIQEEVETVEDETIEEEEFVEGQKVEEGDEEGEAESEVV